jgi:hypothetical protein
MNRIMELGKLVLGALVCFGISGSIFYFLVWPELQVPGAIAEGIVPWAEVGPLLIFAFLWLAGGLIATYLLFRKLTALTGHPESDAKPWLAKKVWTGPVIHSDILFQIFVAWVLALAAISTTIGFFLLARHSIEQGNFAPLLVLTPFALAGLGMLFPAINLGRQWVRFGQIVLTMDPYPGSIGGQVGGQVDIRLPFDSENYFQVDLVCQRVRIRGRGYSRSQQIDLVWDVQGLAHAAPFSKGTRLSFRFDVPKNLPPSELESNDYHEWRLILMARLPGVDLNRSFDIPVFPTAESSIGINFDSTEHSGYGKLNQIEVQSILELRYDRDGVVLEYAIFNPRKVRAGLILMAVGLGASLPGIAILMDEVSIVGIMFSLVGLLFGSCGFYILFHKMAVKVSSIRLRATTTLLGIPIRTREAARSEIDFLGVYGGNWIAAWKKEGKRIIISQRFSGEKVANLALKTICDRTGYPIKSKRKRSKKRGRQSS